MSRHEPEMTAETHGTKAVSIARQLAAAIHAGLYAPGQRLIEAELTANLGISRSVLREAFRCLSAEGTIELIPNRGALVRRLTRREALELFQIRLELEALAARLAAENIDRPGARAAFTTATAAIHAEEPRHSTSDYICENARFHAAIFEAADNWELGKLNRQLQLSLIMAQISPLLTSETIRASLAEHRAIAAAILRGDAAAADGATRAHLARARGFVQAMPQEVFHRDSAGPAEAPTGAAPPPG